MTPLPPPQSLPAELRAGDALDWTVQTGLPATSVVFFVLTGVVANSPTRLNIGGNGAATTVGGVTTYSGAAVDAMGLATFSIASATSAAWLDGRYQWVAFAIDATGRRTAIATGTVRILPDVNGASPADPRSYNQQVLDSIRAVIAGTALDDVQMYKIGGRELTRIPRMELFKQLAIFEARVRNERIRRGENVPTKTAGITFGGR